MPKAAASPLPAAAPQTDLPARAQVEQCLEDISRSAQFARSERMQILLRFLVTSAYDAPEQEIREQDIAAEVFGRRWDWDPKVDPIVRTAVSRLRNKLDEYYSAPGHTLRIALPKGQYRPIFEISISPDADAVRVSSMGSLQTPPIQPARSRQSIVWIAGAVALVTLAIVFYFGARPRETLSDPWTKPYRIRAFAADMGQDFSAAISPDGRRIAYVWDGNGGVDHIFLKPLAGGSEQQLTFGAQSDLYPAWSPDGKQIAFLRQSGWQSNVMIKSLSGGGERTIATITTPVGNWTEDSSSLLGNPGPAWSRDGTELTVFDQDHFGIYAISASTRERRQLTEVTQTSRDFYPRVSPDGRMLAFVRYRSHGIGDVYVTAFHDLGPPRQITHDQRDLRGIAWMPDGKSLVLASNRTGQFLLWSLNIASGRMQEIPSDTSEAAAPAIGPDSRILAFDNIRHDSEIDELQGLSPDHPAQVLPLIAASGQNRNPALSPDGTRLAFMSDRSGQWQIWLANADGSSPHMLTHLQESWMGGLVWSPRGDRIAFDARPTGQSSIYILDVATGRATRVTNENAEDRCPSWSADGTSMYFSSDRSGRVSLYRLDLKSGKDVYIAPDGFKSQITADGRILYWSTMSGVLWRSMPDGSEAVRLPDALQPEVPFGWTTMGDDLIVIRDGPQQPGLWRIKRSSSSLISPLASSVAGRITQFTGSPNGPHIYVETDDPVSSTVVLRQAEVN